MANHLQRRAVLALALVAAGVGASRLVAQPATPGADRWEEAFRALPVAVNIRAYDQRLSARPHHVGSAYDKDNAEWILARFKEWGWDAQIERFDVLFPTPKERVLEMTAPTRFVARLDEPAVPVDPTSGQKAEQLPTYNAYSTDGDVTGRLVYVNYGRPADYEELARLGISVKGAIVIVRYGASWRGIKPKVAAEHGAIGCLIYSDPADDGYYARPGVPRRADAQQGRRAARAASWTCPLYPGDPLTPGVGATPEAKRLAIKDAPTITKIPGAADLVRRRAAAARGHRRADGAARLARRAADALSDRPRSGDGAPEARVQLGHQAALRRDRDAFPAPPTRTSGSSAATITTRG